MDYTKSKSAIKRVTPKGPALKKVILNTMKLCADIVGSTIGPGGQPVLIERQEEDMPPTISKDGVTCYRALGFEDATQQVILESSREAASKTAGSAGDGTSTTTVLAEALIRNLMAYCETHPKVSPQRVVRSIEKSLKNTLEPAIKSWAKPLSLSDDTKKDLHSVAKVSANGDSELADAVLECFELVGNDGNVTLQEESGRSGYQVERLEGYPVGIGYEDSCGGYYPVFLNDTGRQICELKKPVFILYFGRLNDIYPCLSIFDKLGGKENNVVLVATGFSDNTLSALASNFAHPTTAKIFPLKAPLTQMKTGQMDFLMDLAALTGATIFDPLNNPIETAEIEQLGRADGFEASRYRSNVFGFRDELLVLERVDQLKTLLNSGSLSALDVSLVNERLGKITGGIAKLKIIGASSGELKEKRDRAEDAICSVRAAINHGCLPGGGWTLLKLQEVLKDEREVAREVLIPSLQEPVNRLFTNAGYHPDEIEGIIQPIKLSDVPLVYDILEGKYVEPFFGGVLDSVPAVLEALRNSISIASQLGTCGGIIAYERDMAVERQNARDTAEWKRNANVNEADEKP